MSRLSLAPDPVSGHAISLQGRYVEQITTDKGRLKWLCLDLSGEGDAGKLSAATAQEDNPVRVADETAIAGQSNQTCWIKVPKAIGSVLPREIQIGSLLRVWVRPKKDYYKALMIVPLSSPWAAVNPTLTNPALRLAESDGGSQNPVRQPSELVAFRTPERPLAYPHPAQSDSPKKRATKDKKKSQPWAADAKTRCVIRVCQKGSCRKRGAREVEQALNAAVKAQNLGHQVEVAPTRCLKNCKRGPNICVLPQDKRYSRVRAKDVPAILARHTQDTDQLHQA